jgi:hypothetical protein
MPLRSAVGASVEGETAYSTTSHVARPPFPIGTRLRPDTLYPHPACCVGTYPGEITFHSHATWAPRTMATGELALSDDGQADG